MLDIFWGKSQKHLLEWVREREGGQGVRDNPRFWLRATGRVEVPLTEMRMPQVGVAIRSLTLDM